MQIAYVKFRKRRKGEEGRKGGEPEFETLDVRKNPARKLLSAAPRALFRAPWAEPPLLTTPFLKILGDLADLVDLADFVDLGVDLGGFSGSGGGFEWI